MAWKSLGASASCSCLPAAGSRSPSFSGHLQRIGFALVIPQSIYLLCYCKHGYMYLWVICSQHIKSFCVLQLLSTQLEIIPEPLDCCQCHTRKVCQFTSGPTLTNLKVQKEKSTRDVSCWTNQCCNTSFCILSLMSRTGFLLPPPVQQQLQPHLSGSLLPLVIYLVHTLEKQSDSKCSIKIFMSSREGTGCSHPVQTLSETANSIF